MTNANHVTVDLQGNTESDQNSCMAQNRRNAMQDMTNNVTLPDRSAHRRKAAYSAVSQEGCKALEIPRNGSSIYSEI